MDFEPSPEPRALAEAVERFGRRLSEGLPERDRHGTFDREPGTLYSGTSELQRRVIARLPGL